MEYKKGNYFGEKALITNESRAANIIATVNRLYVIYLILEWWIGGGVFGERDV